MSTHRYAVVLAAVLGLSAVSGCASSSNRASGESTAIAWHTALGESNGESACALLAPGTVEQLEESSGQPCADAVAGMSAPSSGRILESDVFSQAGWVRLEDDVVFLARFGTTWKVTAAGCTERAAQPYECTINGG